MRLCPARWLPVLFLGASFLSARADTDASAPPVTDPAVVTARYHQLLAEPQFQEPNEPDVDTRMRDWLTQFFGRFGARFEQFKYGQEMPRFASLLMSIFVVVAIVGLLYTLVRLTRQRLRWERSESNPQASLRTLHPPEFYQEELRHAVAAGDWHGAWLASWRQFLSRLEKGRLVEADRSRTNREYLAQLGAQPQSTSTLALLANMVEAYDIFIYGRRPIAERDWRSFQEQIDEAALLLHLENRPAA
jgi:hypothetical protein